MGILPRESFQFESSLTPDQALGRLAAKLDDGEFIKDEFIGTPAAQAYKGSISGHRFTIRMMLFAILLTPVIEGRIDQAESGSHICIQIHMNPARRASLILWLIVGIAAVMLVFFSQLALGRLELGLLLGVLLIFALGIGLEWAWFKFESSRARNSLLYIFNGRRQG